jgi:cyclomaltodextrinase
MKTNRGVLILYCLVVIWPVAAMGQAPIWGTDKPVFRPELKPDVPEWAKDAVWYQTWVQFFRNGDPANDPTSDNLEGTWPFEKPQGWQPFPMTSDPYSFQPWEEASGKNRYSIQHLRRYGGDFRGFIDKLDYLKDLGVTAVYFCPLFEAPAYHTYDTSMYHHVLRFYGPDPRGDKELYKQEKPEDPSTWVWTAADKQFVELLKEAHKRGIRIVPDGVFTYVGRTYWDERIRGENPPSTPEFRGYIKAVVKKWGDPNGDGDPADGIDGWRLDVGLALPDDFIREFRTWVRSINRNALLVVESWYDNTQMVNAAPWLQGDMYDSHMNYMFGDAMIRAFVDVEKQVTPSEMDVLLRALRVEYPLASQFALQNLIGTHDVGRFAGMLLTADQPHYGYGYTIKSALPYSYQIQQAHTYATAASEQATPSRNQPTEMDRQIQRSMLTFQYCYLGAPYIYMGDETGIWYGTRTPMIWADLDYAPRHPFGPAPPVKAGVDREIFETYKALGQMRAAEECLRRGSYNTVLTDDRKGLYVFERALNRREKIRAVFNLSKEPLTVDAIADYLQPLDPYKISNGEKPMEWRLIMGDAGDLNKLPGKAARVYKYVYRPENEMKMLHE